MKKYLSIGFVLAVILFIGACTASKRYVQFEVLQPAEITYPEYVQNVAFLNRSPLSKYSFGSKNQEGLDDISSLWIIDTLISNNIRKGFDEGVQVNKQSYYRNIQEFSYRRRDTVGRVDPMTPGMLKSFFDLYNVDALISLEYYDIRIDQSEQYYDFENGVYYVEIRFISELLWRIYEKEKTTVLDEYLNSDTLFYMNHSGMSTDELLTSTRILRDGAVETGYRYGLRVVPLWKEISRFVYSKGNADMISASRATSTGDWERAIGIWIESSKSEDLKLAAKSLHNLAVYYEMEDDLARALNYSNEANLKWESKFLKEYNSELERRIKNKNLLLKQVR